MAGKAHGPGEGERLSVGASQIVLKATAQDTGGAFFLSETRELGPGSFACAPPGTVHTFSNPGAEPVRSLNFNTPGGFELYMRELAEATSDGPIAAEAIAAIASRHDFQVA